MYFEFHYIQELHIKTILLERTNYTKSCKYTKISSIKKGVSQKIKKSTILVEKKMVLHEGLFILATEVGLDHLKL